MEEDAKKTNLPDSDLISPRFSFPCNAPVRYALRAYRTPTPRPYGRGMQRCFASMFPDKKHGFKIQKKMFMVIGAAAS
jgi:hypothetical protein